MRWFRNYLTLGFFFLSMVGTLNAQNRNWNAYGNCHPPRCNDPRGRLALPPLMIDRFAVRLEALYWKATEDNLAFATEQNTLNAINSATLTTTTTNNLRKKELDFTWNPGVRLSIDCWLPCNKWNLGFAWTHLYSCASNSANAPDTFVQAPTVTQPSTSGELLVSTFLIPTPFSSASEIVNNLNANHIGARWNSTFDNYEWDIGRSFDISCFFAMRPYIGLKLINIEQRYNINYTINQNPILPDNDFGTLVQRINTCYSGFGFQGGFDSNWVLGRGFCLYSNVSGGIVYGRARVKESLDENIIVPGQGTVIITNKFKDCTYVSRPNVDLAIGLTWQRVFGRRFLFGLRAGWEYHHYFNQNFFRMAQDDDSARGDFAMHGLAVGVDIGY
jgi:Legionella pneumophila major outer membrane protein precursor